MESPRKLCVFEYRYRDAGNFKTHGAATADGVRGGR